MPGISRAGRTLNTMRMVTDTSMIPLTRVKKVGGFCGKSGIFKFNTTSFSNIELWALIWWILVPVLVWFLSRPAKPTVKWFGKYCGMRKTKPRRQHPHQSQQDRNNVAAQNGDLPAPLVTQAEQSPHPPSPSVAIDGLSLAPVRSQRQSPHPLSTSETQPATNVQSRQRAQQPLTHEGNTLVESENGTDTESDADSGTAERTSQGISASTRHGYHIIQPTMTITVLRSASIPFFSTTSYSRSLI